MKHTVLKATLMAAMIGISAGEAGAADYKKNPFTLTYDGAITKNEPSRDQRGCASFLSLVNVSCLVDGSP